MNLNSEADLSGSECWIARVHTAEDVYYLFSVQPCSRSGNYTKAFLSGKDPIA